jgi:hypothetical protein
MFVKNTSGAEQIDFQKRFVLLVKKNGQKETCLKSANEN